MATNSTDSALFSPPPPAGTESCMHIRPVADRAITALSFRYHIDTAESGGSHRVLVTDAGGGQRTLSELTAQPPGWRAFRYEVPADTRLADRQLSWCHRRSSRTLAADPALFGVDDIELQLLPASGLSTITATVLESELISAPDGGVHAVILLRGLDRHGRIFPLPPRLELAIALDTAVAELLSATTLSLTTQSREQLQLAVHIAANGLAELRLGIRPIGLPPDTAFVASTAVLSVRAPLSAPTDGRLSAGVAHFCAVHIDGTVWCWGDDSSGQLGNANGGSNAQPRPVLTGDALGSTSLLSGVHRVASGALQNCALRDSGEVYCWGLNLFSQLGSTVEVAEASQVALPVRFESSTTATISDAIHVDVESETCVIRADQTVWCWGEHPAGAGRIRAEAGLNPLVPTRIDGIAGARALSLGSFHGCALTTSATVWCWGVGTMLGDGRGEDSPDARQVLSAAGVGLHNIVQLSAGDRHSCAVSAAGRVWCWGEDRNGEVFGEVTGSEQSLHAVPVRVRQENLLLPLSRVQRVGAFGQFSCGLVEQGPLRCWGLDLDSLFGNRGPSSPPFKISTGVLTADGSLLTGITEFAGDFYSLSGLCALRQQGSIYCWGDQAISPMPELQPDSPRIPRQLLLTVTELQLLPAQDPNEARLLLQLWVSDAQGLPTALDNSTLQWSVTGGSPSGPAERRLTIDVQGRMQVELQVLLDQNAAETEIVFATTGLPATVTVLPQPLRVVIPRAFASTTQISAGLLHVCIQHPGGTVWCRGSNDYGQLGNGASSWVGFPTAVFISGNSGEGVMLTDAFRIASGPFHSCALVGSGSAWCWGRNRYFQQGSAVPSDAFSNIARPVIFPNAAVIDDAIEIDTLFETCVIRSDRSVWCWGHPTGLFRREGFQSAAELRFAESTADRDRPQRIAGIENAVQLALGAFHGCALTADGEVLCWGDRRILGRGDAPSSSIARTVITVGGEPLAGIVRLSAGFLHSCALSAAGLVHCWGNNDARQVTAGALEGAARLYQYAVPLRLRVGNRASLLTGATAIHAGLDHSCGLYGGSARCWGDSEHGQFGNGPTTPTPGVSTAALNTEGMALSDLRSLSTGGSARQVCGVNRDGLVHCWGEWGEATAVIHRRAEEIPELNLDLAGTQLQEIRLALVAIGTQQAVAAPVTVTITVTVTGIDGQPFIEDGLVLAISATEDADVAAVPTITVTAADRGQRSIALQVTPRGRDTTVVVAVDRQRSRIANGMAPIHGVRFSVLALRVPTELLLQTTADGNEPLRQMDTTTSVTLGLEMAVVDQYRQPITIPPPRIQLSAKPSSTTLVLLQPASGQTTQSTTGRIDSTVVLDSSGRAALSLSILPADILDSSLTLILRFADLPPGLSFRERTFTILPPAAVLQPIDIDGDGRVSATDLVVALRLAEACSTADDSRCAAMGPAVLQLFRNTLPAGDQTRRKEQLQRLMQLLNPSSNTPVSPLDLRIVLRYLAGLRGAELGDLFMADRLMLLLEPRPPTDSPPPSP